MKNFLTLMKNKKRKPKNEKLKLDIISRLSKFNIKISIVLVINKISFYFKLL